MLVGPQGCGAASLQVCCAALGDLSGAIPDLSHAILEAPEGTVDRATLHLRRAECIAQVAHHTIARRVERTEQSLTIARVCIGMMSKGILLKVYGALGTSGMQDLYNCLVAAPGAIKHVNQIGDTLCKEGLIVDGIHMVCTRREALS